MSKEIKLSKGLDINLKGEANKVYASVKPSKKYSLKPTNFQGLFPKLLVKIGDQVKAGTPLFIDKYNENIKFCSAVSGKVVDIVRGKKRRILDVIVQADSEIVYEKIDIPLNKDLSREQIISVMLKSGVWPFIRQRPYDTIANPNDIPKAIFISSFTSAPISIDNDFALYGMDELFQKGLDYIVKLTKGKTHLNVSNNTNPSQIFLNAKGVEINKISGPHPSGNVGVQINHIDPINKDEVVWYINPQDVIVIARLFSDKKYDVSRIVALSGEQVLKPRYYRVVAGSSISNLLLDNLKEDSVNRIISGDILTGEKIDVDGFLGFYDSTITVIKEGKEQEFLGWLKLGFDKFSASRTFLSWLFPKKKFSLSANMHGEERAYVMTGEYEKVFPMDIYPTQLVKSIMMEDIELMEQLGIYEVVEEDFALCEFICTSKMPVQSIIRHGLDLIRKENN